MGTQKKISVIVPIYKTERYLRKCVRSIQNQTYQNLEIILVDDGSPDHCPEICDELALQDKRIVVIHKENGGVSSARNAGLDRASGEYVGFVDGDDWIKPEMYQRLFETLTAQKAEVAVCGYVRYRPPEGFADPTLPQSQDTYRPHEDALRSLTFSASGESKYDDTFYPCWNKLFAKDLWDRIRFDEDLAVGEDCLAVFQALLQTDGIAICREALYCYQVRSGSATHMALCERSGNVFQMAVKMVHTAPNTEAIYKSCIENLLVISFSYMNALANVKAVTQYRELRKSLLTYRPDIRSGFRFYSLKFRVGLFLLFYLPRLFWTVELIRTKKMVHRYG